MIDQGKQNVLGVEVSAVDYDSAVDKVMQAAREQRSLAVTALAVHGVMTGVQDKAHGARLNSFDLVTPDGQPVRWALNLLYHAQLADRVYGPDLTLKVLAASAAEGLPVYFYGSTQETLDRLAAKLHERFGDLKIAGMEPSKFRPARDGEPEEIAARIRSSGARVVMVGLGCPRQEVFVYAMKHLVDAPMLAVGAAFDYHAGGLKNPPPWMQRYALEWLWRLGLEPKRLWRRYILLNPNYLARLGAQKTRLWRAAPPPPATEPLQHFAV
ncbi:WecB/TagA/CpsF family glycosyltransferase [Dactylosporangium matsuzakiense]|uniref:UDP-N-acetyl-D-mannosaminuronic acid transferase n=1 Tax=Dactylosporangium matsuzakiense TaxID=53360 RepID=A0A9W6NJ92_9ACTN|nr:WecB/TagA/CpsF family glycosyltransferase [Dactylosporangium matsuzakiense]UWZ45050.1 WecB/TagA/CpsF family glycosyltransferase [Dactylosporangium matsuzakiense]GLK99023.1 UDP-N-acetyl-D-mannosaminuronic acid transferase [Dactylosporangium matsuzakiense]